MSHSRFVSIAAAATKLSREVPSFTILTVKREARYAANEDSDTVKLFKRDAASGVLAPTDQTVKVGSPVCILFRNV
ncbi:beta-propeller fold lactonase family protein [Bradyrhizobium jicamae]|nr:beta-propeller fold lactonase family protein [Bradyrhizobium jicamae]